MSTLVYNGVTMDMVSTMEYSAEPVRDPTGTDQELTKVTLTVQVPVNRLWVGTRKVGPGAYGTVGDSMPTSLYRFQQLLEEPRQQLTYTVNGITVLEAPQRIAPGTYHKVDAKYGPMPKYARVVQIYGVTTAIMQFSIECWVSQCTDRICLSNLWRMRHSLDENGYTTQVITGRASFRKDFLTRANLQADDFRALLILPADPKTRRTRVDCDVSEDGTELRYSVTDVLTNVGMGRNSSITKIETQSTMGGEYDIKSFKDTLNAVTNALGSTMRLDAGGFLNSQVNHVVPTAQANTLVRVFGQPNADRKKLARTAIMIALDNFTARINLIDDEVAPVSLYLTIDRSSENEPFAEARMELSFNNLNAIWQFIAGNIDNGLNFSSTLGSGVATFTRDTPRTDLPGGRQAGVAASGTRGEGISRMVTQILSEQGCQSPAIPPAPGDGLRSTNPPNAKSIEG